MEYVSNQNFTDSEFMQWRQTCTLQGIPMPTHDELDQKLKDIKEAMIYEFKEEDIEQVGVIMILPFHKFCKGQFNDCVFMWDMMLHALVYGRQCSGWNLIPLPC